MTVVVVLVLVVLVLVVVVVVVVHSFIRFFIAANVKTHLFYKNTDIYCNYVNK